MALSVQQLLEVARQQSGTVVIYDSATDEGFVLNPLAQTPELPGSLIDQPFEGGEMDDYPRQRVADFDPADGRDTVSTLTEPIADYDAEMEHGTQLPSEQPAPQPVNEVVGLTEEELLAKINRDIAAWRDAQEQVSETEEIAAAITHQQTDEQSTKSLSGEAEAQYEFEPLDEI